MRRPQGSSPVYHAATGHVFANHYPTISVYLPLVAEVGWLKNFQFLSSAIKSHSGPSFIKLSRQETPNSVARNMKKRCQVRFCKFSFVKISVETAVQDTFVRLSVRGAYKRPQRKISVQTLYRKYPCKISVLFTASLYKISIVAISL